ncbi:MAG: hypothetical protein K2M47_02350 [Clostridiales bacterium]|nr:hypothetical protein [Clostridiales bacterium]
MKRKFRLTIDGKIYHAEMIDNPLVEQIAAMCPFEQTYRRYTEHEYYTELPKPTSQEGCMLEAMARKNQIGIFTAGTRLRFCSAIAIRRRSRLYISAIWLKT